MMSELELLPIEETPLRKSIETILYCETAPWVKCETGKEHAYGNPKDLIEVRFPGGGTRKVQRREVVFNRNIIEFRDAKQWENHRGNSNAG